jgi:NAD(P)-dependent dehydrogenase (short-subunit alcohol dehydrogenase family)
MRHPESIADLFRLDGRVALVTGAGGAFGRAIALGFATRLEETAEMIRTAGGTCALRPGDTGASDDVAAVYAQLDQEFGKIDILVNNAGRNPVQGKPELFPLEIWKDVLRTNLTGYFLLARAPRVRA